MKYIIEQKMVELLNSGKLTIEKSGDKFKISTLWNRYLSNYSIEGKDLSELIECMYAKYTESLGYDPIERLKIQTRKNRYLADKQTRYEIHKYKNKKVRKEN